MTDDAQAGLRAGLALSHAGDARALAALRTAHARLVAAGDPRDIALCAAALVMTAQVGGSFRDMAAWLVQVKAQISAQGQMPQPGDDELLLSTAQLIGQLFFDLADPEVDGVAARLVELLEADADVNLQFAAARVLLYYVDPRELRELGQRVNSLVQPRLSDPALTPHRHGHWLLMWRSCTGYAKETLQEDSATEAARTLAERHGLRDIQFTLAFDEVSQSLPGADLPRAERALAKAETLVDAGNLRQLMLLDVTRMRIARLKGQNDEALFRAVRARKYAVELHCPGPMMGAYIVNEANVRLLTNDFTGARAQMQEALPLLPDGFALEVREMIAMIVAFEALHRGEAGGRSMMAAIWAGLRERQFYDSFEGHPEFRARLCMLALEQQIEVEFVTNLIRKCGIAALDGAPENWPFPLRINALGQFSLQRDGAPIAMEGKAQRKPLDMLRVLVAHGATTPGTGMQTEALIDLLWPDLDAEAPKASFDMTLMRLRKLLQVDGALRLAEGRLWLDPRIVWCDVTAFEFDCAAIHLLLATAGNELRLSAAARRLRSRPGNKLFGNSAVEPWSIVPRERLARQFAQAVTDYGEHLEVQGAWIAAISLYEQGLADDMFAEPWYRGLMRCHLALHQPAAALRCFQRCRDLLSSVLKVRPSAETLALLDTIPVDPLPVDTAPIPALPVLAMATESGARKASLASEKARR